MPRKSTHLRTRLERERRAAKLSQTDLAKLSGEVTQATISRIEGGKLLNPSFTVLDTLARTLNRVGRRVQPGDLQPRPQPVLIKGVLQQPRKRGAA